MRLFEIAQQLNEVAVFSSWIEDLDYDEDHGNVIMTLLSGREYTVHDVPEDEFLGWIEAPSHGKYWHAHIRDLHTVTRNN